MAKSAIRDQPKLWEQVKSEVTASDRGGRPGQWSARKAQMAVQEYKKRGGGYIGPKSKNNSLARWAAEDWGTASGRKSLETGERYLPRKAREHLSGEEYRRTSAKKRQDMAEGMQFSRQPEDVAAKTSRDRRTGTSRDRRARP